MKFLWTTFLIVGLLDLTACGGSRKQKAATVKKESATDVPSDDSSIPDLYSGDPGSLDQFGTPQQPAQGPVTFGSVEQQRQQMQMQEFFRQQEEQYSFGGMAAQVLPSIIGMGGGGAGGGLGSLFSGLGGATQQASPQQVNPNAVAAQQTFYQQAPNTASAPIAGPDQSSFSVSGQLPGSGFQSFVQ